MGGILFSRRGRYNANWQDIGKHCHLIHDAIIRTGWVIKACPSLVRYDMKGKFILPMVKVRGRDYLRLIYGIDYLEDDYFAKIKNRWVTHRVIKLERVLATLFCRSVSAKRTLSRQQHELAMNILKCFLGNQPRMRLKYLAAFYGLDFQTLRSSDKDYLLL